MSPFVLYVMIWLCNFRIISYFSRDGLTVEDALNILDDFDDLDTENIYIVPPDPNEITDENSGNEDGGLVDNLCGRQLQASA